VTEYVNKKSSLQVSCWAGLYGVPLGSIGWSSMIESRSQLADETRALATDAKYAKIVAKAAEWVVGQGEDTIRTLVSGGRGTAPPPALGSVALRTTAVVAMGQIAAAMAWCVEMAEYASILTGTPVGFFTDAYGTFGSVAWISVADSMAEVDKAEAMTSGDAGYIQRLVAGGDLFVPASGHASLLTRIA
jgi:hypothetical protein